MNSILFLLLFNFQSIDNKYNYHTEKADIYYHRGDYPNMIFHLKEKIKLDKHDIGTYADIAYYYWSMSVDDAKRRKEFQLKALGILLEGLKNNRNSADMLDEVGNFFLHNLKDLDSAVPFYEQSIKMKNPRMSTYHFLAAGYYKKGEKQKSIKTLEECIKRFPQDEKAKSKIKELKKDQ